METPGGSGSRPVVRAVLLTVLTGTLAGLAGRILPLKLQGHALTPKALLWGGGLGATLGAVEAVFVFVFPKAEDDPTRWKRWAAAALVLGFGAGAVASLLELQDALR